MINRTEPNPPIYQELCRHCNSRWHLTDYCPTLYKGELLTITPEGDQLRAYPDSDMADTTLLSHCFAVHHTCNGFVDLKPVTSAYNAIVCRVCKLRIVISNAIETFGELRWWIKTQARQRP